jgi:hypothetical protein
VVSDPKQPDEQADDLDLDADVVGDLEPDAGTADEVRGGDKACTHRSNDIT